MNGSVGVAVWLPWRVDELQAAAFKKRLCQPEKKTCPQYTQDTLSGAVAPTSAKFVFFRREGGEAT